MADKASLIDPKSVTFWLGILIIMKAVVKAVFDVDIPLPAEALEGAAFIGLRRAIHDNN